MTSSSIFDNDTPKPRRTKPPPQKPRNEDQQEKMMIGLSDFNQILKRLISISGILSSIPFFVNLNVTEFADAQKASICTLNIL